MAMAALPTDRLAGSRVFFGHQSVGKNIIAGVRALLPPAPGFAWRIVELPGASPALGGFLAHQKVGRNGDPRSKTREFSQLVSGPLGSRLDVALHKYCYADIDAATDVAALFKDYRQMMAELQRQRPDVTLVHVTVPLVRVRTGPKAWLQRVLGRTSPRVADNARREMFNDLLRGEYAGRQPLFNLADRESAGTPRALRADFTDDGGHLNDAGRRDVALGLLECLGGLARPQPVPETASQNFENPSPVTTETPFFFPSGKHSLFGILHQPAAATCLPAFVFCHPFGEEKLWTHRVFVSFARRLARARPSGAAIRLHGKRRQ